MAIFPPGAGIVKGTAIVPLTRSQESVFQRHDEHEVNGTLSLRWHAHYLRQYRLLLSDTEALTELHYALRGLNC